MHRRQLLTLIPLAFLLSAASAPGYERGELTVHVNLDRSADVEVALSGASDAGVVTEPLLIPTIPVSEWRVLTPETQPSLQTAGTTTGYGVHWLGRPADHVRLSFHIPDAVSYAGGHNQLDLSWMSRWQVPVGRWQSQVTFPPEQIPGAIWLDDDQSPGAESFSWRGRPTTALTFGYWPLGERHNEQRLPQNLHYLLLWAGLTPSFYALARYQGRRPRRPLIPPSAGDVAYLAGGSARAVAAALLHLVAIGAVQAQGEHWPGHLSEAELEALPPLPRLVYRLVSRPESRVQDLLHNSVIHQDTALLARQELVKKGFLPSDADIGRLGGLRMAAVVGLLAMAAGIVVANAWDVPLSAAAWLTTVLGVAVNLGWLYYGRERMKDTPDGRRWLTMNRNLANQRLQADDRSLLKDDAVQMDVAFFGSAALAGTSFAYLAPTLDET